MSPLSALDPYEVAHNEPFICSLVFTFLVSYSLDKTFFRILQVLLLLSAFLVI